MLLTGKNILIGITGGIAAYKICELVRMFKRQNANVKVVLTKNALEFVTPLTLETLSQEPVYINQFDYENKMFLFDSRVIRSARRRCGTRCWTVRPGSPPHGASRSSDPARCSGRSRRV